MAEPISLRLSPWIGITQGALLYALYRSHKDAWWPPESAAYFNAALLVALLLPLVVYWSHAVLTGAARRWTGLASLLLTAGLAAYQGAMSFPVTDAPYPPLAPFASFAGLALLNFMLVPLAAGRADATHPADTLGVWVYTRLFDIAWRNAVVSVQAGVLTGLLWIVLSLGAQLFRLIGIDWPRETLREAWFAIPLTTLTFALAMRAGLRRAAFTTTLRNHWLSLTTWLLPVTSFIGAAFVLTSLAGVEKLFEGGLSAFFLLWFAAFWVKFFNSAYQDGATVPALHSALRKVVPLATLALAGVVALAAWALGLRIAQHGLTPDRLWGALVVTVAAVYAAGYALSLRSRAHWMASIAPTNVLAALTMASGIVLLLSPLADANRLATANQMARLEAGRIKPGTIDVSALAQQGRYGQRALLRLIATRTQNADTEKLAIQAEDAMTRAADQTRFRLGYERNAAVNPAMIDIAARLDAYPKDRAVPPDFVAYLKREMAGWENWKLNEHCLTESNKKVPTCLLLQIDLDRDARPEILFWEHRYDAEPVLYGVRKGSWKRLGSLSGSGQLRDSARAEIATGSYSAAPAIWDVFKLGDGQLQVIEDSTKP